MLEVYLEAAFHLNLQSALVLTEAFDSASIRPKFADCTKNGAGKIRTPPSHLKGNGPPTTYQL